MKKNRRIEKAREIIANLRREMDRPRLTESVRNGLSGASPLAVVQSARLKVARQGQTASQ
jgi:hypothetical protein